MSCGVHSFLGLVCAPYFLSLRKIQIVDPGGDLTLPITLDEISSQEEQEGSSGALEHSETALKGHAGKEENMSEKQGSLSERGPLADTKEHLSSSSKEEMQSREWIAKVDGWAPLRDFAARSKAQQNAIKNPASLLKPFNQQGEPPFMTLCINFKAARSHPLGARAGHLLEAIPEWKEWIGDMPIHVMEHIDWLVLFSPSLTSYAQNAIILGYSASSDALVDQFLEQVTQRLYPSRSFDNTKQGVYTVMGTLHQSPHVFMKAPSRLLLIGPAEFAPLFAKLYASFSSFPLKAQKGQSDDLAFLSLHRPSRGIPMLSKAIREFRFFIKMHQWTHHITLEGEGDCKSEAEAPRASRMLMEFIQSYNSLPLRLLTHGLLDGVKIEAKGSSLHLHLPVTEKQLEALLSFGEFRLGISE
ncbi:hypothetical protein [Pajaroellobacter abortibovis]|nr:hypothetical protein [Pajaroellobacter abortibovis]